jgi:N-acyl-D-aspartate/D-glutamate deacylase
MHKDFQALRDLSTEERTAALRSPEVRAKILANCPDLSKFDGVLSMVTSGFGMMYPLGKKPNYEPSPDQSIEAISLREGRSPQEVAYDILASEDGGNILYLPMLGYVDGNLDATRELMRHPNTVYGLADGGAHCGMISDASIPTFLLTHWGRDRTRGERIPIEELVENQTRRTAECYGLLDRGVLEPGKKADINLIDFDNLHIHEPVLTYDLPADGKRFLQKIDGYRMTICSGQVIYKDGAPTGALPGKLIRGGRNASGTNGRSAS